MSDEHPDVIYRSLRVAYLWCFLAPSGLPVGILLSDAAIIFGEEFPIWSVPAVALAVAFLAEFRYRNDPPPQRLVIYGVSVPVIWQLLRTVFGPGRYHVELNPSLLGAELLLYVAALAIGGLLVFHVDWVRYKWW